MEEAYDGHCLVCIHDDGEVNKVFIECSAQHAGRSIDRYHEKNAEDAMYHQISLARPKGHQKSYCFCCDGLE